MTDISEKLNTLGMYAIWRIEKQIWLEGQSFMKKHVKPDAIMIPPAPLAPGRFEHLVEAAKRAEAFSDVELQQRQFLKLDHAIIISYLACAKHRRYRSPYYARCSTTYVRENGLYKIAAHTHNKLPKNMLG